MNQQETTPEKLPVSTHFSGGPASPCGPRGPYIKTKFKM